MDIYLIVSKFGTYLEIHVCHFNSRWLKQTENMQATRYRNTKVDKKERQKYSKSERKLNNQQRTTVFKATRRKKK